MLYELRSSIQDFANLPLVFKKDSCKISTANKEIENER